MTEVVANPEISSVSPRPIAFQGGFGYGQERNSRILGEIAQFGYETLPSLPNVPRGERDNRFTLTSNKGDNTGILLT